MLNLKKIAITTVEGFFILLNTIPLIFGAIGTILGFSMPAIMLLLAFNPLSIAFMSDSGSGGIPTLLSELILTFVLPPLVVGIVSAPLAYIAFKSIKTFLNKTYQWYWIFFVATLLPVWEFSLSFMDFMDKGFSGNTEPDSSMNIDIETIVGKTVIYFFIVTPQILYIRRRNRLFNKIQSSLVAPSA